MSSPRPGKRDIVRALPTWNVGPRIHVAGRERHARPLEPPRVPIDVHGLPQIARTTPTNSRKNGAHRNRCSRLPTSTGGC